jgi:putative nucleotidyltransferase with HDIG domain
LSRLQQAAAAGKDEISAATRLLGVFDSAAHDALDVATHPDVNQRQLAAVVESDPVLAALMIQFANSPLFGSAQAITTLPHAVSFVGVEPTRQLLLGIVIRRFMGHHHEQWAHSVAVAQSAEAIAALSQPVDPSVAFLAGLVHDIGRLIFERLPAQKLDIVRLVHSRGCPLGHAESLLLGSSHAEAGAAFLANCRFADSIVEAVRFHHRPDLTASPLASVAFLAEHLSESEEDSVSSALIESACESIAILPGDLETLDRKAFAELLLTA